MPAHAATQEMRRENIERTSSPAMQIRSPFINIVFFGI